MSYELEITIKTINCFSNVHHTNNTFDEKKRNSVHNIMEHSLKTYIYMAYPTTLAL